MNIFIVDIFNRSDGVRLPRPVKFAQDNVKTVRRELSAPSDIFNVQQVRRDTGCACGKHELYSQMCVSYLITYVRWIHSRTNRSVQDIPFFSICPSTIGLTSPPCWYVRKQSSSLDVSPTSQQNTSTPEMPFNIPLKRTPRSEAVARQAVGCSWPGQHADNSFQHISTHPNVY